MLLRLRLKVQRKTDGEVMPGRPNPPKGWNRVAYGILLAWAALSGMHWNVTLPLFFLFNVKEYMLFPPHSFSGEWEVWEFSSWRDNWHPLRSRRNLPGPCEQPHTSSQMQYCTWASDPRESRVGSQVLGNEDWKAESSDKAAPELCSFC